MAPFMAMLGNTLLGAAASVTISNVLGGRVSEAEAKRAAYYRELMALSPTVAAGVKHGTTQTQEGSRRYVGGPTTPRRREPADHGGR